MVRSMPCNAPANRLRELREACGIPLERIARECGVYGSTVARWQDGEIPQEHWVTVAEVLGVSWPYLLGAAEAEAEAA